MKNHEGEILGSLFSDQPIFHFQVNEPRSSNEFRSDCEPPMGWKDRSIGVVACLSPECRKRGWVSRVPAVSWVWIWVNNGNHQAWLGLDPKTGQSFLYSGSLVPGFFDSTHPCSLRLPLLTIQPRFSVLSKNLLYKPLSQVPNFKHKKLCLAWEQPGPASKLLEDEYRNELRRSWAVSFFLPRNGSKSRIYIYMYIYLCIYVYIHT